MNWYITIEYQWIKYKEFVLVQKQINKSAEHLTDIMKKINEIWNKDIVYKAFPFSGKSRAY